MAWTALGRAMALVMAAREASPTRRHRQQSVTPLKLAKKALPFLEISWL